MTSLSVEMRAKREASPSARRRDAPDATGRLKSFNVEGRGSRALPRSSCKACPSLMRAVRVRSRHFNGRQPIGLGNLDCGMSLLRGGWGGLCAG